MKSPSINSSKQIKVSVVVPTYNHEKYIGQCLDSVINQKVDFQYEVLVGEDNSTDTTRMIIKEYEEKYPGLVKAFYRDGKNKIILDGITTGIYNIAQLLQACNGEYIAFCDGDDFWNTDYKLQKQVDFLDKNPDYTMCFHNSYIVNDDGKIINDFQSTRRNKIKVTHNIEDLIEDFQIRTASMLFRNKLDYHNLPALFYSSIASDWIISILNSQYGKIRYINEPLSSFRNTEKGLYSSKDIYFKTKHHIAMLQNINEYYNYKYQGAINKALEIQLINMAQDTSRNRGYYEIATKILEMADFDKKLKSLFRTETNIFIYGAGTMGKIMLRHMQNASVQVRGFIETFKQEYKTEAYGLPVYDMGDITNLDKAIIVVTPVYDFEIIFLGITSLNDKVTVYSLRSLLAKLKSL